MSDVLMSSNSGEAQIHKNEWIQWSHIFCRVSIKMMIMSFIYIFYSVTSLFSTSVEAEYDSWHLKKWNKKNTFSVNFYPASPLLKETVCGSGSHFSWTAGHRPFTIRFLYRINKNRSVCVRVIGRHKEKHSGQLETFLGWPHLVSCSAHLWCVKISDY